MTDLVIVGEAFGENERRIGSPFVGKAGYTLYRMMFEAGFPMKPPDIYYPGSLVMKSMWGSVDLHLTNVFMQQPEGNNVELFFGKKDEDVDPSFPMLKAGAYIRREFVPEIERLRAELESLRPNLILALGNTACWAILGTTKISVLRGTVAESPWGKVLPTYHPAAVMRNYELRPITITDLFKARREMATPDIIRRRREIWTEPSIPDLYRWWEDHGKHSTLLSVDIETERCAQVSEIGMASDATHALHIPFIVNRTKSYWSLKDEVRAWEFVRMVLASDIPKVGQNFLYDIQYLWKVCHIPVKNFRHDTMLLHHALYPGMQKSLGFLGSVYTDEPAWKTLRKEGNKEDA